jgi:hypothetical protein
MLLTCDALTTTARTSASGSTPFFWNTVGRKHLHAVHTNMSAGPTQHLLCCVNMTAGHDSTTGADYLAITRQFLSRKPSQVQHGAATSS